MAQHENAQLHAIGDKVKLIFNLFDRNRDGRVSKRELTYVMQRLDRKTWTNTACDQLWNIVDVNGDGEVQFTEFWAWVCGHGAQGTESDNPLQDALLSAAVRQEEERLAANEELRATLEAKRLKEEKDAEEKAKAEAERAAGLRISRNMFEQQYLALGFNKDVVHDLYCDADDDGDGDVDVDELGVLNANRAATVGQIKGLVLRNIAGPAIKDPQDVIRLVDMFTKWDVDGNGTISSNELLQVIQILNPELTEVTVSRMIKEADRDGNEEVNIIEFVQWLCGNPKKKKEQQEQEAKVLAALHRHRHKEAMSVGRRCEFEQMQCAQLTQWCLRNNVHTMCNTFNSTSQWVSRCGSCKSRHGWLCHGCGFVSFFDECVHGCVLGDFAWTCLIGTCAGKKCGCKKKRDVWRRNGFAMDPVKISWSLDKQLDAFHGDKTTDAGEDADAQVA
mmetsp:Transcript_66962/g.132004  ORF Transcript_66962/g.132004 Transcript_66962/m.132004 type:complete len:447 (-) Transcript_66962:409-1749(-)